ncbi:EthD family reductase [Acidisoma sp.]|uniref:EthD family reductase n=1 Tax=Acidisoma sp. TaxID=1872115 RepID=UPI003B0036F2
MATTITVLYETTAGSTFDLAYYMAKHMPLVEEKFKPFGLRSWRVLRGVSDQSGGDAKFGIIANLEFDTAQQFRDAVAAEGGPVFGDVPNFTNLTPVVVIGEMVDPA